MYSRYYLIDRFKRSEGERAAIAYLKKKKEERRERRIMIAKTFLWAVLAMGGGVLGRVLFFS